MNHTLTDFGRELRKFRIDVGTNLGEMAQNLGISSSFLSAVELGKKSIPTDLIDRLTQYYGMTEVQRQIFEEAVIKTNRALSLRLTRQEPEFAEVAAVFARSFNNLSIDQLKELRSIFNQQKELK